MRWVEITGRKMSIAESRRQTYDLVSTWAPIFTNFGKTGVSSMAKWLEEIFGWFYREDQCLRIWGKGKIWNLFQRKCEIRNVGQISRDWTLAWVLLQVGTFEYFWDWSRSRGIKRRAKCCSANGWGWPFEEPTEIGRVVKRLIIWFRASNSRRGE